MAGSRESGWLNAQRSDGRRERDTMMMTSKFRQTSGNYKTSYSKTYKFQ